MGRRLTGPALLAASLALLAAAGRVGSVLRERRGEIRGMPAEVSEGGAVGIAAAPSQPPPAGVTLASTTLGIFRGLAIDYLWLRSIRLEEEGRYFESLGLARWITALQSRLPEVWIFQAWNLSYNISVAFPPGERWPWVWNGIRLLREDGLRANPTSLRLYRELAWIFWHKIGQQDDLAHARGGA